MPCSTGLAAPQSKINVENSTQISFCLSHHPSRSQVWLFRRSFKKKNGFSWIKWTPVVKNGLGDEATDELKLGLDLVPVTRFRVPGERHRVEAGRRVDVLDAGVATAAAAGFIFLQVTRL